MRTCFYINLELLIYRVARNSEMVLSVLLERIFIFDRHVSEMENYLIEKDMFVRFRYCTDPRSVHFEEYFYRTGVSILIRLRECRRTRWRHRNVFQIRIKRSRKGWREVVVISLWTSVFSKLEVTWKERKNSFSSKTLTKIDRSY